MKLRRSWNSAFSRITCASIQRLRNPLGYRGEFLRPNGSSFRELTGKGAAGDRRPRASRRSRLCERTAFCDRSSDSLPCGHSPVLPRCRMARQSTCLSIRAKDILKVVSVKDALRSVASIRKHTRCRTGCQFGSNVRTLRCFRGCSVFAPLVETRGCSGCSNLLIDWLDVVSSAELSSTERHYCAERE